jgi:hypothetical protein
MDKLKPIVAAVLIGGLLFAVGLYGGRVYDWLFPRATQTAAGEAGCDLHSGPCTARLPDGGEITLSITPRPIPALAPLMAEVQVKGLAATSVTLDINGVTMNMGLFRTALKATEDGGWRGKTGLPVCTTSKMDWLADVQVKTADGLVSAPFSFSIQR